jgi:DNA-binding MurR/RpiR family transcriptional regulator
MNILDRIHAAYYQLTAAERKVADYVLQQYEQVQFMSITQLAEECGIAEATVSRFCRSLKLKGFNAFKIELAKYSAGIQSAAPQDTPIPTDTPVIPFAALNGEGKEEVWKTIFAHADVK